MRDLPNPGSEAAQKIGCKCPVMDNAHGRGTGYGKDTFWINGDCPIHAVSREEASVFIRKNAMKKIGL